MTEHTDCQDETMPCEDDYNCEGHLNGCISGTIKMRCECNCPEPVVHKTVIHQLPCDVKEIQVGAATQTYLDANPLVQLLSILDIGHAGWILVLKVPV